LPFAVVATDEAAHRDDRIRAVVAIKELGFRFSRAGATPAWKNRYFRKPFQ
jgi:hypothetical protein